MVPDVKPPDPNRTVPLFFNYPRRDCIPARLPEMKRNRPASPRRDARQWRRSDAANSVRCSNGWRNISITLIMPPQGFESRDLIDTEVLPSPSLASLFSSEPFHSIHQPQTH